MMSTIDRALELSSDLGLDWTRSEVEEIAGHSHFGELLARLEAQAAERRQEQATFAEALRSAALTMRLRGPIAKYRCWSCKAAFQAHEKDPHICPTCGTDLDQD